jgi:hypothetical protein
MRLEQAVFIFLILFLFYFLSPSPLHSYTVHFNVIQSFIIPTNVQ